MGLHLWTERRSAVKVSQEGIDPRTRAKDGRGRVGDEEADVKVPVRCQAQIRGETPVTALIGMNEKAISSFDIL